MPFSIAKTMASPFDRVLERLKEELDRDGLVIAFELDVRQLLREHLDVSFRRYRILGVLSPAPFHRGVLTDERVGLVMPCHVVVHERGEGSTEVAACDPREVARLVSGSPVEDVAKQLGAKLEHVLSRL